MPKKIDTEEFKRPRGRPTMYRPEYCERVIEMGRDGKSITQMAATLGFDKVTLLDWRAAHPDFATALTRATALAQQWWEDRGQSGLGDRNFNAALWMKIVASRYRDDYADRKEITGANGGPLQVQSTVVDVSSLDPDDLQALEIVLRKAADAAKEKGK